MFKQFKDNVLKQHLLKENDTVVVAVSGGPDSVALLLLLKKLRDTLPLTLVCAHLDHMMRKNSDQDCRFVAKLSQHLGIPFITEQIDIPALCAKGGSVEEIARNQRLGFLLETARKIKAKTIALGHTFDDQAETVLMRIIRGSGLQGLSGISPKRTLKGVTIIRPMLDIRRRDIEKYLKNKGVTPRRDTTNASDIYFRNKIRNDLIPLLEQNYNTQIKNSLCNLARTACDDYAYIREAASKQLLRGREALLTNRLLKMHPALRRAILRTAIERIKGNKRKIDLRHIDELVDLIANRPSGSIVDLPQGISVVKRKKLIFFRR